jgi:membrane associated rhomboid family serine protease
MALSVSRSTHDSSSSRWPLATILMLALTAGFTTAQFWWPVVLEKLRRDPAALKSGEWWRILSPILVHDGGSTQILFNFTAIAIVGTIVERIYGPWRWLLFYLAAALAGEFAGYVWQPQGAGASVAGAGLLGALLTWLVSKPGLPWSARVGGTIGLVAAVTLTCFKDIHGPPILFGASLASEFMIRRWKSPVQQTAP